VSEDVFELKPYGFTLHRGNRNYEVKGIAHQGTQLRVTIKATRNGGESHKYELSTLDLYSGRSRHWFSLQLAKLFSCNEDVTHEDLTKLLEHAETIAIKNKEDKPIKIELSDVQKKEAAEFLQSPTLLEDILVDFDTLGFVGERTNKLLGYLVATSRKLLEPLSLLIQSRSGAGKSALQDAILSLMPEEDYFKYSRITDQALFYKGKDSMVHKLLAIEEAAGMGGAAYSIRAMQSAKKLRIAATGKDVNSGKMKTEEYEVQGPVSVLLTTTQTNFDQETLSRFLCVTVDESSEMTKNIHTMQRYSDTIDGILKRRTADIIKTKYHNAQRLLAPLVVANPYAPQLSFPIERLSTRREHAKYLGLIKAMAFLHQHQREKKVISHEGEDVVFIEATLADIALVNALAKEVLTQSNRDATPQALQLFLLIRKMLMNGHSDESKGQSMTAFNRRQLREYTGWSDWQLRIHLEELVELEYLHVRSGKVGKEYVYQLGDGAELLQSYAVFGLTDVDELRVALNRTTTTPSNTSNFSQPREPRDTLRAP